MEIGKIGRQDPLGSSACARRRPPISGIITTFNREKHLKECIESLLWCDEVLVVDSFSTDGMRALAKNYDKVRLLQREYYGSASQKNWAMDRAAHDWMLVLDDDERCTEKLRIEIEALLGSGPEAGAYTIRRRCYVLGKAIRFSGWQNDRVVRFLRKGAGRCPSRRVHGAIVPSGSAPLLHQPMVHHLIEDLEEYLRRMQKYGYWGAAQLWKTGCSAGVAEVFGRCAWRFFYNYFVRLGVLDGMRGLVFCLTQSYATFLKWSILWSWRLQAREGIMPRLPAFDADPSTGQNSDASAVELDNTSTTTVQAAGHR